VIPPWLSEGALNLAEPLHEMPRKPEKLLPKFDPDRPGSPEDHIKNLFLATHLLNVQHEDVVCRIFPYTFVGRASTWYFNLPPNSITSWEDFEKDFIGKFGERKTIISLYKELGAIKMEKREKVKDFNQCFTTILTNFTMRQLLYNP
jgi:hypothetical protein